MTYDSKISQEEQAQYTYENSAGTGTIIADVDAVKVLGTQEFGAPFNNGLTIVNSGAKITVVYE